MRASSLLLGMGSLVSSSVECIISLLDIICCTRSGKCGKMCRCPTVFILSLPILFLFGWLPQFNTFVIFFLEQIDIHVFGGTGWPRLAWPVLRNLLTIHINLPLSLFPLTASTGLLCSVYSIARSLLLTGLLYPLGYAAFSTLETVSSVDWLFVCGFTFV